MLNLALLSGSCPLSVDRLFDSYSISYASWAYYNVLYLQEATEGKRACFTAMSEQPTDPEEIRARANADPEIQVGEMTR